MRRTRSTDCESAAGDWAFAARQRLASTRMTPHCELTSAILAPNHRILQSGASALLRCVLLGKLNPGVRQWETAIPVLDNIAPASRAINVIR
jgi:hypothetical protein